MDEEFELPVEYKGEEYIFKATLVATGYTHKFQINIKDQVIIFEPDEERKYRAVIPYEELSKSKNVDQELLQEISSVLEELFK